MITKKIRLWTTWRSSLGKDNLYCINNIMQFHIDRKYIEEGLVTERSHPTEPYLIYNYTPVCQFSKSWDEITMQCRGLIVHKDTGEVIARPFPKFFNYEEHISKGGTIPNENPKVYDKRDGSLGILYWGLDGTPYIATRGSFTSEQALWATDFFRKNKGDIEWNKEYTYLFEIIYPQNRIVVDYGTREGLDLLAVRETKSGKHVPITMFATKLGMPVAQIAFTSFEELKSLNVKNSEGFVLHFEEADLRLKIKFEDYVRLHKVMTGLSQIGIWEMLRDGKSLLDIVGEIPDEMHEWVREIVAGVQERFDAIEVEAANTYRFVTTVQENRTRKDQAFFIQKSAYSSVVFAMLDGKDYKQIIWKMVRPHGSVTFRKDIDV